MNRKAIPSISGAVAAFGVPSVGIAVLGDDFGPVVLTITATDVDTFDIVVAPSDVPPLSESN